MLSKMSRPIYARSASIEITKRYHSLVPIHLSVWGMSSGVGQVFERISALLCPTLKQWQSSLIPHSSWIGHLQIDLTQCETSSIHSSQAIKPASQPWTKLQRSIYLCSFQDVSWCLVSSSYGLFFRRKSMDQLKLQSWVRSLSIPMMRHTYGL